VAACGRYEPDQMVLGREEPTGKWCKRSCTDNYGDKNLGKKKQEGAAGIIRKTFSGWALSSLFTILKHIDYLLKLRGWRSAVSEFGRKWAVKFTAGERFFRLFWGEKQQQADLRGYFIR
jgi:hypothetical protein